MFDSLPQNILKELKSENQERLNSFSGYESRSRLTQINFKRYEDQLDGAKHGNCVLSNVSVAKVLAKKIMQYDNVYYELINYCIMPNHVHLLVDTQKYSESSKVESSNPKAENVSKWMKLIKGGSSFEINKYLKSKGTLWAAESFDRFIRNENQFQNIYNYILQNPIKARIH